MFDKTTEVIAHMIGVFHIAVEEARMRDVYAKFKAIQAAEPDTEELIHIAVTLNVPYTLTDFTPEVDYTPSTTDYFFAPADYGLFFRGLPYQQPFAPVPEQADTPQSQAPSPFINGRPLLTLEPPGSVATITLQAAWMDDSDELYLNDVQAVFVDPSEYVTSLHTSYLVAQTLGAMSTDAPLDFSQSTLTAAITLHENMGATDGASRIGETVSVFHGADADGSHMDGETVEDTPILDDVMPAYFSDENPDVALEADGSDETSSTDAPAEGTAEGNDDPDALENTDPFEGLGGSSSDDGPFDIDAGHNVVTGGNVMINDASISVGWLDAPVISVMGDVVELNSISQVNVLFEHVTLNGHGAASLSASFNVAMMSYTSTAPVAEDGTAPADSPAEDLGLPQNWAVTRIDGDILTVNWVNQFSFMTDHDRADIQFTGSNTHIVMGDNTIANVVDLAEIGYGYDLIMIGGSLITINQISQTNVMMDYDTITSSADVPFTFSGGDNLLFNGASISTTGVNSYGEMTSNFATASEAFAAGATTITEDVAHDSVFEGDDLLTVLYISGDLTTVNWLEQTNVMGDSDQVHLALDNFEDQTGASVDLVTGSNAAINLASVDVYGIDSDVRVEGDIYSDALLYQANLIDTDSDPLGVALPALATEAVAFLADGMIGPDTETSNDIEIIATPPENSGSPDMMQTMLA